MRFIRDIIAEKTQSAAQADTSLRYPLRLNEQDRTDTPVAPQSSQSVADARTPSSSAWEIAPEEVAAHAPTVAEEETTSDQVNLSAISEALSTHPEEVPNPTPFIGENEQVQPVAETTALPEPVAEETPAEFENLFAAEPAIKSEPEQTADTHAPSHSEPVTAPEVSFEAPPTEPTPTLTAQTAPEDVDLAALQVNVAAHKPAAGRGSKGRVKTRLLGFSAPSRQTHDPLSQSQEAPTSASAQFPVGWLVVVDGPGRGAAFSLFDGLTQIGRGEGQTLRLDFGDNTISRENHAAVAFDGEQRRFYFGHGGKANLVRLNGRPVLSTEPLETNSIIRIGETTLRFVALCGADFAWGDAEAGHAEIG